MHFTCRSFIGRTDNGFWSQYWENEPDDSLLSSQRGHLFGLISVSSSESNLKELGHSLIDLINREYFTLNDSGILSSLSSILKQVQTSHADIFDDLSIILVAVHHHQLFVATLNNLSCILSRQNLISPILKGNVNEVSVISGPLNDGDKLLFCTHNFYRDIGWDKLKSFLADAKLQNIEENILSELYSIEDQNGLSAALIQVHQDGESAENEVVLPRAVDPEVVAASPPVPLSQPLPTFNDPSPVPAPKPIYVGNHDFLSLARRKKLHLLIAVLLLITLAISILFGYKRNQTRLADQKYQDLKTKIDKTLNDAYAVKNLNLDNAKNLATEANDLLKQVKNLKSTPELIDYQQKIDVLLSQTGSTEKFQPEFFYDTSNIFTHPAYQQLLLSNRQLYLLDANSGRIDSLNLDQRNFSNISKNDSVKKGIFLSLLADKLYLVTSQSVSEVDQSVLTTKIDFSKLPSSVTPLSLHAWNGAFYLLDGQANSIWKFTPNSKNFSPGAIWLKSGQTLPDNSISMAINGSIWVLSKDCKIVPYNRGASEKYQPKNLSSSPSCHHLFTSPTQENLIFVQGDSLLQVYKKSGDMNSKFDFGTHKIIDFALDESTHTLYVLCTDQKIYKIAIN